MEKFEEIYRQFPDFIIGWIEGHFEFSIGVMTRIGASGGVEPAFSKQVIAEKIIFSLHFTDGDSSASHIVTTMNPRHDLVRSGAG